MPIAAKEGLKICRTKILVAQGGGSDRGHQPVVGWRCAGGRAVPRRCPCLWRAAGVRGIVNDDLVDLGQETVANLEAVAATPAAALGSTRDKTGTANIVRRFSKVLKAHAIDTFF